ncbi:MAG: HD domain-containing protein, partial [Candidatus Omnitrophota bacterium]
MTQQQNGDFSPINLKSFIIDTKINFDLYMLHPSQNRHVLFSSKNTQFSDATRKILLDNKVPSLYISPCDYDLYLQYIEKYLNRIISNTTIATPQKSEWIFECAKKITHDTLDNPDVRKNIRRSTTFVKNLVGFITKERSYFPHVQKLFETDYSLSCHSINVCMYALALCVAMGESSLKILEGVGMGCLLHDIGMTVIPHDILHKDGALDELERETIQKHPEFSTQLLNNLSVKNELIYDIAKSHHEKL